MANLSDEAKKRAKEIERAGAQAAAFFSKIRNEALALAGVFTAGMGIKSFIESTIGSAISLGYMAKNLSLSTQELQAWQRAAQRAGGTSEGITALMKQSTLELANAKMGRTSEEAQEFYRRGGQDIRNFKTGNELLLAKSKIIKDLFAIDPSQAMLVAQKMGVADQFDFVKGGPEEMIRLRDEQMKNSKVTDEQTKQAQELNSKWLDFKDNITTVATQLILKLAPALTVILKKAEELSDKFIKWVGDGAGINKWVDDFVKKDWSPQIKQAKDFADSVKSIAASIKDIIDRWDEWVGKPKVQTEGVTKLPGALRFGKKEDIDADSVKTGKAASVDGTVKNQTIKKVVDGIDMAIARTMASFGVKSAKEYVRDTTGKDDYNVGPKTDANKNFSSLMEKSKYVVNKLVGMGWTKEQAAGIVGSLMQESTMDENALNPQSGAYGVAQWLDKSRIAAFEKYSGRKLKGSTLDQQLEFMNYEMTQGAYKKAGDAIRGASNPEDAAVLHRKLYEQPGESEANDANRKAFGRVINDKMSAPTTPPVAAIDSRSYMKAFNPVGASAVRGNVSTNDVTINGDITVHTKATDAAGIADGLRLAIQERLMPSQSNTGLV